MYIEITPMYLNYLENDCEAIFAPQMWWLSEDADPDCEICCELTDEDAEFCQQWLDDDSCGCDLCFGRAKGLARDYTAYDVWNKVTNNMEVLL